MATRRAVHVSRGAIGVYATCLCLAQVALTTPLAFEQPGKPLLDVDPPLPLGGGGAVFSKRPPPQPQASADSSPDSGSFSDRGIAVLLDDDADLPPPRLRLPNDKAPAGGSGISTGHGFRTVGQRLRMPAPGMDASRELVDANGAGGGGGGVRTIAPLSIEMKAAGDEMGDGNRSFPLKSYVDRMAMQHQRVLFVKSKVRELLKHNSSSSRTMQPAPPAAAAAAMPPPCCAVPLAPADGAADGERASYAGTGAFSAAAAAQVGGGISAAAAAAAIDLHGGSGWPHQPHHLHAQHQQPQQPQQQQALAVERLPIAAPCFQDQAGSAGDWRSTHVNVPVVPLSTSVQWVVAASLNLFFQARPSENKTRSSEEKVTVLLQQTMPCGRIVATSGVRRTRRVVGHMRVPESFVGHVRFNLNRVLSSCVETGGRSRWLVVSVLTSTGHMFNARDFFNAGPCPEGEASGAVQHDSTASTSSDDAYNSKAEEIRIWKTGDDTGSAEQVLPKHYVEMTVALKRTP